MLDPIASPPPLASLLTGVLLDGLASDSAVSALGKRLVALRLVFPAPDPKRCCTGHQPAFIAVDPDEPTLPEAERSGLCGLRAGVAIAGVGLRALEGGIVALPGLSLSIGAPRAVGRGLGDAVILTLADAARAASAASGGDELVPRTLAVIRGTAPPPAPWRCVTTPAARITLSAGLEPRAATEMAA